MRQVIHKVVFKCEIIHTLLTYLLAVLYTFTDLYYSYVVSIKTLYEIFIYVEGGISEPNLKAG